LGKLIIQHAEILKYIFIGRAGVIIPSFYVYLAIDCRLEINAPSRRVDFFHFQIALDWHAEQSYYQTKPNHHRVGQNRPLSLKKKKNNKQQLKYMM
jgi:hypothetical protein